jgi:hypothetical protein
MTKMTPEQEAGYALNYGASRSSLSHRAKIVYDRLVKEREEEDARTSEERLRRQRQLAEHAAMLAQGVSFSRLGVTIYDGLVYQRTAPMKLLGPLAGAHAEVGGSKGGHRRSNGMRVNDAVAATVLLGPVGLLAGVSRAGFQGFAVVAFPDGSSWEIGLADQPSVQAAQIEAARFNTLTASATSQNAPTSNGIAAELERLAALHSSGLLDNEEFRAAKARIIGAGGN